MAFNYDFKLTLENGQTRTIPYSWLVEKMEIADVEAHGRPMREGGTPQALLLKDILEKDGTTVEVWFQGNQIF